MPLTASCITALLLGSHSGLKRVRCRAHSAFRVMSNEVKRGSVTTLKQIMREQRQIPIRHIWGPWRFQDNLVLVNPENYEIDLEQINTNSEMLDCIFQVSRKRRDAFCVKSLIEAFHDIYYPQHNCCSFGANMDFSGSELAGKYKKRLKSQRQKTRSYLKPSLRFKILHRDQYRCQACGASPYNGVELHIDHIVPVSKGGTNEESNLRALCSECNIGRGNRYDT